MKNLSFIDFIESYGAKNQPKMIYREGSDFKQWQHDFRHQIRELLGPRPERLPLAVETVEVTPADGHTRHLLRIAVNEFSQLYAYLLVPDDLAPGEQRPGVVILHGHAKYGIDSICGVQGRDDYEEHRRAYGLQAVQSGFIVLSPAWWGWTGRDEHLGQVGGKRDRCNVIQMAASMYGLNITALHVQDGMAAIDTLLSRPEVTPDMIGCMGNSYGGRMAMWLSIFDERIKASVVAGCMNTFRERSLKLGSCAIQYPFGILQYGDVPELFSLIAPQPLQLQAGQLDSLITPADRDAILKTVEAAYRELDRLDDFQYILHEDGHILLWEQAKPFLETHLRLPAR
ncbi:MAG: dienelactone hydrolase family protein [Victivallaceae bacterium]|nr:dienelactone hydrolase family protein [Victivallaceae bacterium]